PQFQIPPPAKKRTCPPVEGAGGWHREGRRLKINEVEDFLALLLILAICNPALLLSLFFTLRQRL
ncbi:MAG: hypothetical protein RR350_09480, partial [Oscillibacter sp.]